MNNPFRDLTKFECALWLTSIATVVLSFVVSGGGDWLTMVSSLVGVTALIFVAKGYVLGQVLTVVFAVFYGVVSFFFRYYGEVLTYLGMTAPIALAAVVSWLRHPYQGTKEVAVSRLTLRQIAAVAGGAAAVTVLFYFVLQALGTANLLPSTVSVTTSFVACALTYLRSPYYAVGYAANDIVLIVLWALATAESLAYLPMLLCFVLFLVNDLYGFYNWQRMRRRQQERDRKNERG